MFKKNKKIKKIEERLNQLEFESELSYMLLQRENKELKESIELQKENENYQEELFLTSIKKAKSGNNSLFWMGIGIFILQFLLFLIGSFNVLSLLGFIFIVAPIVIISIFLMSLYNFLDLLNNFKKTLELSKEYSESIKSDAKKVEEK